MNNNLTRVGNFTSSQMYKLAAVPKRGSKPFLQSAETYIEERWLERVMQDSVHDSAYSRAMAWGKFCEAYLFSHKLGTEYKISSQDSVKHPDEHLGNYWAGTCDFEVAIEGGCISETKSYYRKKFALYSLAILKQDTEFLKEYHPEEYWQIVSNSIIHDTKYGEAICFMPSYEDLEEMRGLAEDPMYIDKNGLGPMWQYRFIYEEPRENLQLLNPKSKLESVNRFRFEVPQEDKDFLTERVELAIEKLEELL